MMASACVIYNLDLPSNSHLRSPLPLSEKQIPPHFAIPISHQTRAQQKGTSSSRQKKIRKNNYFYLLWSVIVSPGSWEELSVISNGIALWHLAPDQDLADKELIPWTKGLKGQEPQELLFF